MVMPAALYPHKNLCKMSVVPHFPTNLEAKLCALA